MKNMNSISRLKGLSLTLKNLGFEFYKIKDSLFVKCPLWKKNIYGKYEYNSFDVFGSEDEDKTYTHVLNHLTQLNVIDILSQENSWHYKIEYSKIGSMNLVELRYDGNFGVYPINAGLSDSIIIAYLYAFEMFLTGELINNQKRQEHFEKTGQLMEDFRYLIEANFIYREINIDGEIKLAIGDYDYEMAQINKLK